MDVRTKCYDNPSKSCRGISLKIKNMNFIRDSPKSVGFVLFFMIVRTKLLLRYFSLDQSVGPQTVFAIHRATLTLDNHLFIHVIHAP